MIIRSNHEPTPYSQNACVRVGVAILLTSPQHSGCVLIGRRLGSHGEGKLALPGKQLLLYFLVSDNSIRWSSGNVRVLGRMCDSRGQRRNRYVKSECNFSTLSILMDDGAQM